MSTVASYAEVQRAKLFLKSIGAYATNKMIVAVVAFLRVERFDTNAEVKAAAARLLSSSVYTRVAGHGAHADAINARNKALADAYKAILTAARKGETVHFLYNLVLSSWDDEHFGGYNDGSVDPAKNKLLTTYDSFTGLILHPPTKVTQPPPPPPKPVAPRDLPPPPEGREYLDPGEAQRFYHERHKHDLFLE